MLRSIRRDLSKTDTKRGEIITLIKTAQFALWTIKVWRTEIVSSGGGGGARESYGERAIQTYSLAALGILCYPLAITRVLPDVNCPYASAYIQIHCT